MTFLAANLGGSLSSSVRCSRPFLASVVALLGLLASIARSPEAWAQPPGMEMEGYEQEMMEMEMESGYGDPSQMRRGSRGSSTSDLMGNWLQGAFESAFGNGNLSSLTDPDAVPPVAAGPVLENEAVVAYAKGDHPLAMRLFFGHIVAEYESAEQALKLVKYSPLMKRPAWQIRWGFSYAIRGDEVEPQPIQESASRGNMMAGMGQEMGMEMMESGMDDMQQEMEMQMQREMEMQMQMEMEMQSQSGMEMQMMNGMRSGMRRPGDAPAAPQRPSEILGSMERSFLSEAADEEIQNAMGLVATILGEEFDKRYSEGDFGRAMTDVTADSGDTESISSEFVEMMQSTADPLPMWRPNMAFLGKGDSSETLQLAKQAGLDLIFHVDVSLKDIRGQFVQTICRCRIFHVPSGKSLGLSKPVDSLELAQKARMKGLASRDYVNEQLSNLFGIIDRSTKTTEMPTLTPDIARRRVGQLLASEGGKNLRTLAEVRLFQLQKLLTEEDVLMAFDIVGGEDALQMIFGSESERLEIVRQWASGVGSTEGDS